MATLNLFCLCIDQLSTRYGDRICDMSTLNIINWKLTEIEELYRAMPSSKEITTTDSQLASEVKDVASA